MKLTSNYFVTGICFGIAALILTYLAYRGVVDTRAAIQTIIAQQDDLRIERIKKERERISQETLNMKYSTPEQILEGISK